MGRGDSIPGGRLTAGGLLNSSRGRWPGWVWEHLPPAWRWSGPQVSPSWDRALGQDPHTGPGSETCWLCSLGEAPMPTGTIGWARLGVGPLLGRVCEPELHVPTVGPLSKARSPSRAVCEGWGSPDSEPELSDPGQRPEAHPGAPCHFPWHRGSTGAHLLKPREAGAGCRPPTPKPQLCRADTPPLPGTSALGARGAGQQDQLSTWGPPAAPSPGRPRPAPPAPSGLARLSQLPGAPQGAGPAPHRPGMTTAPPGIPACVTADVTDPPPSRCPRCQNLLERARRALRTSLWGRGHPGSPLVCLVSPASRRKPLHLSLPCTAIPVLARCALCSPGPWPGKPSHHPAPAAWSSHHPGQEASPWTSTKEVGRHTCFSNMHPRPPHTHALLSIPQRQGGRAAAGTAQGPLAGEVDAHCLRECPGRGAEDRGAPSLHRLASPTQHGQADHSGPPSLSDWKVHRSVFLPSAGLTQAGAGSSPLRVLTT